MPKRKSPRQRPPPQSQTQRPQPRAVPKDPPKPKRGTINLNPFEAELLQAMVQEGLQLEAQVQQIQAQIQALKARRGKMLKACGETHNLPPLFKVTLNDKGAGLNWQEVREDAKPEENRAGTGAETPDPGP